MQESARDELANCALIDAHGLCDFARAVAFDDVAHEGLAVSWAKLIQSLADEVELLTRDRLSVERLYIRELIEQPSRDSVAHDPAPDAIHGQIGRDPEEVTPQKADGAGFAELQQLYVSLLSHIERLLLGGQTGEEKIDERAVVFPE